MDLIRRIGYTTPEELGRNNVMLSCKVGPFLVKKIDFENKVTDRPIEIYPIVGDTERTGKVPIYLASLTEEDYSS